MTFRGLDGFDEWVDQLDESHLEIKIYNGKVTSARGSRGDSSFLTTVAMDKEDIKRIVRQQLTGVSGGVVTIVMNEPGKRGNAGQRRFMDFRQNVGVAGTTSVGSPFGINSIADYQSLEERIAQRVNADRDREDEMWGMIAELKEQKSLGERMLDGFMENEGLQMIVGQVIQGVVAKFVPPHGMPSVNGTTVAQQNFDNTEVNTPDMANSNTSIAEMSPEELEILNNNLQALMNHFPNESLIPFTAKLVNTLNANPMMANVITGALK